MIACGYDLVEGLSEWNEIPLMLTAGCEVLVDLRAAMSCAGWEGSPHAARAPPTPAATASTASKATPDR